VKLACYQAFFSQKTNYSATMFLRNSDMPSNLIILQGLMLKQCNQNFLLDSEEHALSLIKESFLT